LPDSSYRKVGEVDYLDIGKIEEELVLDPEVKRILADP